MPVKICIWIDMEMYMLNRNKTLHTEFAWQDNRSPVHFSGLGLKKPIENMGIKHLSQDFAIP